MVNTTLSADKRLKDCQELFGGLKKKKKGSFHHKGELYWWDGEHGVALKATTISKQRETNGDTSACFLFNQWETPVRGMCSPHSGRIFLLHVNVSEDIIRNALEDIPRGVKCPR